MDKQQRVRDFLEDKIKEKGLSLNALSLTLGKNSTYLFHFIKRKSPKRLDENTRRKLASILNINEQMLCDFPLPSTLIPDKLETISDFFGINKQRDCKLISIDVIDISTAKKGKFETIKNNITGQILMDEAVFKNYTSSKPENIKIVKTNSESMSPTINNGDLVWVDTSYSTPSSDGIYLISTAGDTMIKRLEINPFDNTVEVLSDNKAYKSYNIKDYKTLNICGKIVCIDHKII